MRTLLYPILAITLLIYIGEAFGATSVSGSVKFSGKAPKVEVLKMASDPVCNKLSKQAPVKKHDVVVNPNGTLANVFVYVKEGIKKEAVPPAPADPVVFDQKGCNYNPHVFGIRVGQVLKILNSDATMHNVHGLGKRNKEFNNAMPNQGGVIEKKFTQPEVLVKIKCDVHGWMSAYAGVVDHPYFAVTDNTGNFSINGLPPGEYTLEAVHEKLGTKTMKVSVAEAAKPVEFSF